MRCHWDAFITTGTGSAVGTFSSALSDYDFFVTEDLCLENNKIINTL